MGIRSLSTASISTGVKRSKVWDQSAVYSPTAYDSIATVSISSDTNTITFSSIPQTYKHLQLRAITRSAYNSTSVGQSNYSIQFNSDSGANYSSHGLYGNGTSALSYGSSSQNRILMDQPWSNPGGFGAGTILNPVIIDILDYQNTNKYKTMKMLSGFNANSTSTNQIVAFRSGAWYSTSAITSITLDATAGPYSDGPFAANTQWALYGIKG